MWVWGTIDQGCPLEDMLLVHTQGPYLPKLATCSQAHVLSPLSRPPPFSWVIIRAKASIQTGVPQACQADPPTPSGGCHLGDKLTLCPSVK